MGQKKNKSLENPQPEKRNKRKKEGNLVETEFPVIIPVSIPTTKQKWYRIENKRKLKIHRLTLKSIKIALGWEK